MTAFSQVKLQTWEQSGTLQLAKDSKRFTFTKTDHARRGSILDANFRPLAQDDHSYALTVEFQKIPHTDAFFMELAAATGIPATEFSGLAARGQKSSTWMEPVSGEHYQAVMDLRKRWRADGVSLNSAGRRRYELGEGAASFVGVLRNNDEGPTPHGLAQSLDAAIADMKRRIAYGPSRTGLELSLDSALTGKDGHRVGLTDGSGAFLPMRMDQATVAPKDGKDVVLTIDRDMQGVASEAIKDAVVSNKADNGVALVMDPKTGDILAMANWPSFDPNVLGEDQGGTAFNPNYMAQLEPGSMFKILTLAKGIDDGKVTLHDSIFCSGEWHPTPSSTIHCDSHHGNRAHGETSTVDAIARSCNVSAAIWATRIGRKNFFNFIDHLGLIEKSKLNVPGEIKGHLNKYEYARQLQLATLGFGQSITCTPVGLLGAFGMIGNDGLRVHPRIIKRIGNADLPPDRGDQVVKPETAHEVMTCMEQVIQSGEGTGAKLRIPGYEMAGKTGTAEKIGKGEKGYVSNFVGFVPAPQPKALILVMVNHPRGNLYYGADVAGPVFSKLAKAVISHYNLQPTEPLDMKHGRKPVIEAEVEVKVSKRGTATR